MGSSVIFSGSDVKTLKSNIDVNGQYKILSGTADPTSSAQNAPVGSFYINTSTGVHYRKLDSGSSTNWTIIGPDAGVNMVGLDTSFGYNNLSDRGAEYSVGNWVAYDDGANAAPVDMTGGTPASVTLSRTTTAGQVLNGAASFKVVKAAANAQGQGVSLLVNIPPAYRGQSVTFKVPYLVISGSVGSTDLKGYAYDVTNSSLFSMWNNAVTGSSGLLSTVFTTASTTAQVRIGFHFATTSTTAVTFSFDDVHLVPGAAFYLASWALASGSRVTSDPTSLGQYRTQLRNANANTFTDTNGAPTASPTVADGMRIYQGNGFNAADTNNSPTRYLVYIGSNKNFRVQFYGAAGKATAVCCDPLIQGVTDVGYSVSYDNSTGIVYVSASRLTGGSQQHNSSLLSDLSNYNNTVYFDILYW